MSALVRLVPTPKSGVCNMFVLEVAASTRRRYVQPRASDNGPPQAQAAAWPRRGPGVPGRAGVTVFKLAIKSCGLVSAVV